MYHFSLKIYLVVNISVARRSFLQLRVIMQKYEEISGDTLENAIESECRGDLRKGYKVPNIHYLVLIQYEYK